MSNSEISREMFDLVVQSLERIGMWLDYGD